MSDEAKFQFYLNRQGVRGKKGEKGDTGFSPTIEVAVNTAAEYKLRVINEGEEFITDNLRGSAVEDTGGTYMRYDRDTQGMYAGSADIATTNQYGVVKLATQDSIQQISESDVLAVSDMVDSLPIFLKSSDNSIIISQDPEDSKTNLVADLTGVEGDISRLSARVTECETNIDSLDTDKADKTELENLVTKNTAQEINNTKTFLGNSLQVGNGNDGDIVASYDSTLYPTTTPNFSRIAGTVIGSLLQGSNSALATQSMFEYDESIQNYRLATIFNDYNLTGGTNVAIIQNPTTGLYEIVAHDTIYSSGSGINIDNANQISVKVDGSTIDVNSDGELEVIGGGGGSSYTAGDGIDITNDEISVKVDPFRLAFDSNNQLTTVGVMFDPYTRTILDPTSQEQYTFTDYKFPEAGTGTWTPSSGIAYNLKTRLRDGFNNIILTNDMITQANGIQFTPNGDNGEFTIGAKVDGTTITTNSSGELQATQYTLPTASTTDLGGVKVDGTTITIDNNGVISSSGGSTPVNMVTTDTTQTISGNKTFSGVLNKLDGSDLIEIGGSNKGITFNSQGSAKNWLLRGIGYTASTLTISGFGTTTINAGNTSSNSKLILSHDSLIFNKSDNTQVDLLAGGGAQIDDSTVSTATCYSSDKTVDFVTGAIQDALDTVGDEFVAKTDIATTLSSSSTYSQVASAKTVYDMIGDIETLLSNI